MRATLATALALIACSGGAPRAPAPPTEPTSAPPTAADAPLGAGDDAAAAGAPSASLDDRPTTLDVPAPPGDFAPLALPAGVPAELPKDGWWKNRGACPKGSRLESRKVEGGRERWQLHRCVGKVDGRPHTAWRIDGVDQREEGWNDAAGELHGMFRAVQRGFETRGVWIHGVREGRFDDTDLGGGDVRFVHYRAGTKHGLAHENHNARPEIGYYDQGERVGVWLIHDLDDRVRARLSYRGGVLDGEQRWWYADGVVLARGRFADGAGTWELFERDGRLLSRTRCERGALVETTAWDASGAIVVHVCGASTSGCTPVGPTGYRERQDLGADDDLCGYPAITPLERFEL